jgi:hypothetical protein
MPKQTRKEAREAFREVRAARAEEKREWNTSGGKGGEAWQKASLRLSDAHRAAPYRRWR